MKKVLLFIVAMVAAELWAQNNVIYYAGYSKIGLRPQSFSAKIVSHTFKSGLGQITFDKDLENVGSSAFPEGTNLIEILFPASVKHVGAAAFSGCYFLKNVYVDPKNPYLISKDGVLYNASQDVLVCRPSASPSTTFVVPEGVKTIARCAFMDNLSLERVVLPSTLTKIEESAFGYCIALRQINLPKKLKTIEMDAFSNCKSLDSVIIPEKVVMSSRVFYKCSSLKYVELPASLKELPYGMFSECTALQTIVCKSKVPPVCEEEWWSVQSETATLYVPKKSIEAYCHAVCWHPFTNIRVMDKRPKKK